MLEYKLEDRIFQGQWDLVDAGDDPQNRDQEDLDDGDDGGNTYLKNRQTGCSR